MMHLVHLQKIERLVQYERKLEAFLFCFYTRMFCFSKAIQALGERTFEKVHDYLIKQRSAQRTDTTLDEAKITEGLTAFVKKPSDCFLVDQLVFLELV